MRAHSHSPVQIARLTRRISFFIASRAQSLSSMEPLSSAPLVRRHPTTRERVGKGRP